LKNFQHVDLQKAFYKYIRFFEFNFGYNRNSSVFNMKNRKQSLGFAAAGEMYSKFQTQSKMFCSSDL